jgi:CHAT domain-containing protein
LYFALGNYAQAEQSLLHALSIYEKSLSPDHPRVADALNNLTAVYRATGKISQAVTTRQRAAAISEANLRLNLIAGSERQKLNFLALFTGETNDTLSLHAQYAPADPQALQLAFTTWLQRKGRALDEMNQTIGLLRRFAGPEAAALFDQLTVKLREHSQLATNALGEKERARTKKLEEEIEQLESTISARSARFRVETQPVKLEGVQKALPAGSALVEFARYTPVEAKTKKQLDPHYLAYVLLPEGAPQWIELGEAAKIESAVRQWREALDDPGVPSDRARARNLDKLVMQPVRRHLGQARHIFVSPDGALNLIPFAALVDEREQELVKRYLFTYLTSGRDLLRLQVNHQRNSDALIFAVSNFDEAKSGATAAQTIAPTARDSAQRARDGRRNRRSASEIANPFRPLRHARAEGEAIKRLQAQARLFADEQATETVVKQVSSPGILHIITHGFFLTDPILPTGEATAPTAGGGKIENPLLRSGLAFAGANQRRSGEDDGILTAFEAAAMDLWGTKLVVLSACETGIGEVRNGDGVLGLRRALALAGAETQVMSLWRADDKVTKDLIVNYYRRLKRGEGRAEALRQAQLEIRRSKALRHPYFWAGFVQIGEWADLAGKR